MRLKAAIIKGKGRTSFFDMADVDVPEISADEVLVKIYATSVNPVDWQSKTIVSYLPFSSLRKTLILGHDFSGIIVKKGEKVNGFELGDAVYGTNGISIDSLTNWSRKSGTYAEYSAVNVSKISKKPESLTFHEAATLPVVGLTALQGLNKANLSKQDKILIIGGSGGVGSMAVQIAKSMGVHVTAVCSTKNLDFVKSLGADHVIDYSVEDYLNRNENYSVVFNTIGHQSVSTFSNLLQNKGMFIDCSMPNFSGTFGLIRRHLSVSRYRNTFFLYHSSGKDLEKLSQLIETGKIKTVLCQVIDLSQINEGHQQIVTKRTVGKIAVSV